MAIVPLVLLATMGFLRWQSWKRDNPPVTTADLKVRRILQKARFQLGAGGAFLSSAQKQTVISHFWVASAPVEATYPQPLGSMMEIDFFLPSRQGKITLAPDAAFSGFSIEAVDSRGEIPLITEEQGYDLHPATDRFLRAWLQAGAP